MPLSRYVCTNCGYWQEHFAEPTSCPVCLDVRHVPPESGWTFLSPKTLDARLECSCQEVEPGVWRFTAEPTLGIGPVGYLITTQGGNVAFEGCDWYSEPILQYIESLGGVSELSASHPHSHGALWRVSERFGPRVSLQREDLPWVSTLNVGRPFDERLEVGAGLELIHVGGHFDGQSVLHDRERGLLFCGDALKLELEGDGRTAYAISCHKAFVRGIPLTHKEVSGYREVFEGLDFEQVFTTFEQGQNVGKKEVLEMLDALLHKEPSMEPIRI